MAAFDFPASPTVGDIYTANGVSYRWDGIAWVGGPAASVQLPAGFAHRSGSGNVALGTAVFTKIPLVTVAGPNVGGWTVSGGSLVVPKTGTYIVGGSTLHVSPAAACTMLCGLGINGGSVIASSRVPYSGPGAINATMNVQRCFQLAAGNTLEIQAYCSVAGGAVMDSYGETFLWATMISV